MDNPTKVYEENGELYLIPGQTYTFKLTGMPTTGYTVVRPNPLTSGAIQVPENPAADKNQTLLEVTFKDAAENKFRVKPEIKIVKPKFTSLTVTGFKNPALIFRRRQEPKTEASLDGIWQLGGMTIPHEGVVTIKPGAARQEFDVRLDQWVAAETKQNGEVIQNSVISGFDTKYRAEFDADRDHNSVTLLGNNQIKTSCEDFPGPSAPLSAWQIQYNNETIMSTTFKANLYLRYRLKGKNNESDWKNIGKIQWSMDAIFNPKDLKKVIESGKGTMDPTESNIKNGAATNEESKSP